MLESARIGQNGSSRTHLRPPGSARQQLKAPTPIQRDQSKVSRLNEAVQAGGSQRQIRDCCLKCWKELLTVSLFMISLISGLSLTTASVFRDYSNVETPDPEEFASEEPKSHTLRFSQTLLLGLISLVYSIFGLILNCIGRLPGKVS